MGNPRFLFKDYKYRSPQTQHPAEFVSAGVREMNGKDLKGHTIKVGEGQKKSNYRGGCDIRGVSI